MDRTNIAEIIKLHHKASPTLQSSSQRKKKHAKKHIEPEIGGRYQKNESHLATAGKESPGKNGLENSGRQPMLLHDR